MCGIIHLPSPSIFHHHPSSITINPAIHHSSISIINSPFQSSIVRLPSIVIHQWEFFSHHSWIDSIRLIDSFDSFIHSSFIHSFIQLNWQQTALFPYDVIPSSINLQPRISRVYECLCRWLIVHRPSASPIALPLMNHLIILTNKLNLGKHPTFYWQSFFEAIRRCQIRILLLEDTKPRGKMERVREVNQRLLWIW